MLPKVAALSQAASSLDRRNAGRRTCTLRFDAAEGPETSTVVVLDLSRTGMRLWSAAILDLGDRIDVAIPEAGAVSARIVRKAARGLAQEYGAEFEEPISEGAVSAALLAAPALARPESDGENPVLVEDGEFSRRTRFAVRIGLAVVSWLVIGGIGYAIARLS